MKIIATDGITTQVANIRKGTSKEKAIEMTKSFFENDYLGASYYLEDDDGNEIIALEQ